MILQFVEEWILPGIPTIRGRVHNQQCFPSIFLQGNFVFLVVIFDIEERIIVDTDVGIRIETLSIEKLTISMDSIDTEMKKDEEKKHDYSRHFLVDICVQSKERERQRLVDRLIATRTRSPDQRTNAKSEYYLVMLFRFSSL